jgi:alpha-N-arabinofuranosidase
LAQVKIDLDRTIGDVDRRIFGSFVEHLGRCIYGGVFEPGSPRSDERGFRRDVLDAARGLRIPLLRWPGGNFVSAYRWTDGVGPVERRPRRRELAWDAEEPNTFGTDEFLAYCRELGAEPYICLNMGTGTLAEALAWVEYCNGDGDTEWANLRRRNGHEEPYGVRYWGLGNEMYGEWQIGHLSADEYVRAAQRWAAALRRMDPDIRLVSCGQDGVSDWDRAVIDGLVRYVDHHSIHLYTGSPDYWSNVLGPHYAERALRVTAALIERARHLQRTEREVTVAYDEWNVWFRTRRPHRDGLEERYSLGDALAVATFLNVFLRNSRTVRIANQAQLVNAIAPILTEGSRILLQTIYHPFQLFAEHTEALALDPHVECRSVTHEDVPGAPWPHRIADMGPFGVLDVAATRDRDRRRATVTIVNRDPEAAADVSVALAGAVAEAAAAYVVGGASPDDRNTFEAPDTVSVRRAGADVADGKVRVQLPPHSFTCLTLGLR